MKIGVDGITFKEKTLLLPPSLLRTLASTTRQAAITSQASEQKRPGVTKEVVGRERSDARLSTKPIVTLGEEHTIVTS